MNKLYSFLMVLLLAASPFGVVVADNTGSGAGAGSQPGAVGKQRRIIMTEDAMEASSLHISLNERAGTGSITGKVCDTCEEITVKITPETRAFQGGKEVPLKMAQDRLGRSALVFFDTEKKQVTRIKW